MALAVLAAVGPLRAQDTADLQTPLPVLEETLPQVPVGDAVPQGTVENLTQEAVEEALPQETVDEALPQEAVEEALPQEGVEEALPPGVQGPEVLQVDPDVLRDMVQDTAAAPAQGGANADIEPFVASRVGSAAVRTPPEQGVQPDRETYVLPSRVLTRTTASDGGGARSPSFLRPVIQVAGGGVSFSGSSEGYRGTLYVGVQDSLQPGSTNDLTQPIHFLLDVVGGSVEPRRVAVEHTNLPFKEVTVLARETRDSIRLRVRSSVAREPVPLMLPVRRPSLSVSATPEAVSGLGLETTTLLITTNRLASGSTTVTVESTMGSPQPPEVRVDSDGTARAVLRSTGLGATEVRVNSPGYRSASTRVRFAFPLAFLLAALLGGIAGGTARHVRAKGSADAASWIREAGAGVVFGLIVAVAYAVGVNLLGVELGAQYGEALVFTLAALGGYFRVPMGRSSTPAPG